MPTILPIKELKNTANISELCKKTYEPIFITKNGYGDMVLMNMKYYEETLAKMEVATLINKSIKDVEDGAEPVDGDEFFAKMRASQ